jgi:hypothetical protein
LKHFFCRLTALSAIVFTLSSLQPASGLAQEGAELTRTRIDLNALGPKYKSFVQAKKRYYDEGSTGAWCMVRKMAIREVTHIEGDENTFTGPYMHRLFLALFVAPFAATFERPAEEIFSIGPVLAKVRNYVEQGGTNLRQIPEVIAYLENFNMPSDIRGVRLMNSCGYSKARHREAFLTLVQAYAEASTPNR